MYCSMYLDELEHPRRNVTEMVVVTGVTIPHWHWWPWPYVRSVYYY